MAIDQDIRQRAEEMFIIDGCTLQEVAAQQGISERTLANWSSEGEWVQRRREYQNAARDIKYYGKMTRLKLIKDAMTSLDPQKIYAFATLERTMAEPDKLDSAIKSRNDGIADIEIKTPQEAVQALQEAMQNKVGAMLLNPDALNLKSLKEIKEMQAVIDDLNSRYKTPSDKQGGVSDELAEWIKEKILKG